jgi:hypothetical protein
MLCLRLAARFQTRGCRNRPGHDEDIDSKPARRFQMPRNQRNSTSNGNGNEADRYRQAADDALQQLDWAIGYLHGIRKMDISRALARNRSVIRERLHESEQPLPAQQTAET